MLVKIIGSILVMISASLIGFFAAKKYADRPEQIRKLKGLVIILESEMVYMKSTLSECFKKLAGFEQSPVSLFFERAAFHMKLEFGLNAREAWQKSVAENIGFTALTSEDADVIASFGSSLGNSDVEGQLKNIRFLVSQLDILEKRSEEKRQKNEKLFRNLGFLSGIALVIMLF